MITRFLTCEQLITVRLKPNATEVGNVRLQADPVGMNARQLCGISRSS